MGFQKALLHGTLFLASRYSEKRYRMKVVILAGGEGTRIAEETYVKPKPMVEIGGRPILWHIMMHYAHYGFNEFVIALGYKGEHIKKFMLDYCSLNGRLTIINGTGKVLRQSDEPAWTVQMVDTGVNTLKGGRLKRLASILGRETFMMTWADGVSNLPLDKLLEYHRSHGKLATVTAVRPPGRFGELLLDDDGVVQFSEKPRTRSGWINGAFFVLEAEVLDYIEGDQTEWEAEPIQALVRKNQLKAYRHEGFWQCMDTLRDKRLLQELWDSPDPPWRIWK